MTVLRSPFRSPLRSPLFSPLVGKWGGIVPAAEALFARFTTPATDARKTLINNRIVAAQTSGAWSVYDGFGLVGADAQATQRNWKQDLYNLTPQGNMAHEADRGYTSDGTGHLATGFNPSTAGGQWTLNSAHMSIWSRTNAQSANTAMGARTTSTTGQALLTLRNTSDQTSLRLNQDAAGGTPTNTNSSGGFVTRRSASNAQATFRNGASLGTGTTVSASLPNAALVIAGINTGGVVTTGNTYQFAGWSWGGNLTDAMILAEHNANLAYLQGVGAA